MQPEAKHIQYSDHKEKLNWEDQVPLAISEVFEVFSLLGHVESFRPWQVLMPVIQLDAHGITESPGKTSAGRCVRFSLLTLRLGRILWVRRKYVSLLVPWPCFSSMPCTGRCIQVHCSVSLKGWETKDILLFLGCGSLQGSISDDPDVQGPLSCCTAPLLQQQDCSWLGLHCFLFCQF